MTGSKHACAHSDGVELNPTYLWEAPLAAFINPISKL